MKKVTNGSKPVSPYEGPRYLKPPRKKPAISGRAFKRWLVDMEYDSQEAARALGVTRTSVLRWSHVGAPRLVKLAMERLAWEG